MTIRHWFTTLFEVVVRDPWVWWVGLILPPVVFCAVVLWGTHGNPGAVVTQILSTGSILQLCGLIPVGWGLYGMHVALGQPRLGQLVFRWLLKARSLFWRPKTQHI